MSFGVVQYAMASMKYNRSLLSKRMKLKNILMSKKREKIEFKSSNASNLKLEMLRKKMKHENRRIKIEQIIVFILISLYFIFISYVLLFH